MPPPPPSRTAVREGAWGKSYSYYRCLPSRGREKGCKGGYARLAVVEARFEDLLRLRMAGVEVVEKVYDPGEDASRELENVTAAMAGVREERDLGLYDYPGGPEEYRARMGVLADRRKKAAAVAARPAGWILKPTGRSYADEWDRLDAAGRRRLLLDSGIRLYVHKEGAVLDFPDDLAERMGRAAFG